MNYGWTAGLLAVALVYLFLTAALSEYHVNIAQYECHMGLSLAACDWLEEQ